MTLSALVVLVFFTVSVIAIFEKNDFFDGCVTKARFFLTLHDAVLAALEQNQRPEIVELSAGDPEQELDEGLTEEQKVWYSA